MDSILRAHVLASHVGPVLKGKEVLLKGGRLRREYMTGSPTGWYDLLLPCLETLAIKQGVLISLILTMIIDERRVR